MVVFSIISVIIYNMKNKKLSEYAKENCVTYRTAWNRFKKGKIKNAVKTDTGRIIINETLGIDYSKIAIYCRVSSNENKPNLESQADRLTQYAIAKGYQIVYIVKEVGSGINDNRKKLLVLFDKDDWNTLVVEHKDRLTRFGFTYIETLLDKMYKRIEVVNIAENDKSDLVQDFISIITSFCARIYGLRRSKRKTEKLIKELKDDKDLQIKTLDK